VIRCCLVAVSLLLGVAAAAGAQSTTGATRLVIAVYPHGTSDPRRPSSGAESAAGASTRT